MATKRSMVLKDYLKKGVKFVSYQATDGYTVTCKSPTGFNADFEIPTIVTAKVLAFDGKKWKQVDEVKE